MVAITEISLAIFVRVIDGQSNSVITDITVGLFSSPFGVGVNPLTNGIYVAHPGDNSVAVISGNTNTVITYIPVGTSPIAVSVNP